MVSLLKRDSIPPSCLVVDCGAHTTRAGPSHLAEPTLITHSYGLRCTRTVPHFIRNMSWLYSTPSFAVGDKVLQYPNVDPAEAAQPQVVPLWSLPPYGATNTSVPPRKATQKTTFHLRTIAAESGHPFVSAPLPSFSQGTHYHPHAVTNRAFMIAPTHLFQAAAVHDDDGLRSSHATPTDTPHRASDTTLQEWIEACFEEECDLQDDVGGESEKPLGSNPLRISSGEKLGALCLARASSCIAIRCGCPNALVLDVGQYNSRAEIFLEGSAVAGTEMSLLDAADEALLRRVDCLHAVTADTHASTSTDNTNGPMMCSFPIGGAASVTATFRQQLINSHGQEYINDFFSYPRASCYNAERNKDNETCRSGGAGLISSEPFSSLFSSPFLTHHQLAVKLMWDEATRFCTNGCHPRVLAMQTRDLDTVFDENNPDTFARYLAPDGHSILTVKGIHERQHPFEALAQRLPQLVVDCRRIFLKSHSTRALSDPRAYAMATPTILAGSMCTEVPGFAQRLASELKRLDATYTIKGSVQVAPDANAAWAGGAIIASTSSFSPLWITRQQYEEDGISAVKSRMSML